MVKGPVLREKEGKFGERLTEVACSPSPTCCHLLNCSVLCMGSSLCNVKF